MLYEEVFRLFEEKRIRYLLVGGMAANLYGYVRMTIDLDVMVDLSDENLSLVVETMEQLGYVPRVPVNPTELIDKEKRNEWIKEKGAVVFTFIQPSNPLKHVDLFLVNPVGFEEAFSRRNSMSIDDLSLSVVSIDDLIQMKISSGRPRDLEDVHHLKRIKELSTRGSSRNDD